MVGSQIKFKSFFRNDNPWCIVYLFSLSLLGKFGKIGLRRSLRTRKTISTSVKAIMDYSMEIVEAFKTSITPDPIAPKLI